MSLKVLAGALKGRSLKAPTGPFSRPTTSLLRKAVFDICQAKIAEARFLDLFACSGAMGIEAISRGASHATFVEKDRKTARGLQENLRSLGIGESSLVLCQDVFSLIPTLKSAPYDIIYIDPPYQLVTHSKKLFLELLSILDQSKLLAPEALVFIEEGCPGNFTPADFSFTHLHLKDTRRLSAAILHQLFFTNI